MNTDGGGVFAENLVTFCRVLRDAGLPIAPEQSTLALRAVRLVGASRESDLFFGLRSVLIQNPAHHGLYALAFRTVFRRPAASTDPALPPYVDLPASGTPAVLRETDLAHTGCAAATGSSATEVLRRKDFAAMTDDELLRSREIFAAALRPPAPRPGRRQRAARVSGTVDLRRSMRGLARYDGEIISLARRRPAPQSEPLVLLCDVSGSMQSYSRAYLQFAHGMTRRSRHVHTFVFGTRLTPITRWLRHADPDRALAAAGQAVSDWHGGTRIADALRAFHRDWCRRLLVRGGTVVLLTDGLERGQSSDLEQAAATLRRVCRRVLWLNPLLRYPHYQPSAGGARALMPHVDGCLSAHNLDSLIRLSQSLAIPATGRTQA